MDSKKEQPILNDPNTYPTDSVIEECLGNRKKLWDSFFEYIHEERPDFSEEWRYYNDGKSWLLKVVRKSKTVFWTSLIKKTFCITFYFTDKFEEDIESSTISDELKTQFKNGKRYGKLRGLTITFKYARDIGYAKALIAIRLSK